MREGGEGRGRPLSQNRVESEQGLGPVSSKGISVACVTCSSVFFFNARGSRLLVALKKK